jgi:hypothetical protein
MLVRFLSSLLCDLLFSAEPRRHTGKMKIEIKNLPGGAADAVPAVARWLQSADANFQPVDNIKICKNISGLVRTCDELLKKFSTGVQVQQRGFF